MDVSPHSASKAQFDPATGGLVPAVVTRPRKGGALFAVACLVLVGVGAYLYIGRPGAGVAKAAKGPGAIPVMVVAAKSGTMPVYLYGLGSVTALNTVTAQARVSGELVKVVYKEGQEVHKGDLLCEIDPRPFQVQLDQNLGALARDQAQLTNAQLQLKRYQQAQEAIAQATIDTQQALVSQFEGTVKTDQAAVDATKLNLAYCEITSPIDGRVGLRFVDEGNQVGVNTNLVVITQLKPVTVVFSLPEDNIPPLQAKLLAHQTLTAVAYDHDLGKKLAEGTLLAVDNQVNANSGTFQLKAIFPNENESLFPNQFVNVQLLLDSQPKVVIVPATVVQIGPSSSFVYVVKPDNTIEQRTVETGHVEGGLEVVTSGLAAGEVLVADGFDKLQPGAAVTVIKPEAGPVVAKHGG